MQKSRREIDLENYELRLELKKSLAREIGAKVSKEQFIFLFYLGLHSITLMTQS